MVYLITLFLILWSSIISTFWKTHVVYYTFQFLYPLLLIPQTDGQTETVWNQNLWTMPRCLFNALYRDDWFPNLRDCTGFAINNVPEFVNWKNYLLEINYGFNPGNGLSFVSKLKESREIESVWFLDWYLNLGHLELEIAVNEAARKMTFNKHRHWSIVQS